MMGNSAHCQKTNQYYKQHCCTGTTVNTGFVFEKAKHQQSVPLSELSINSVERTQSHQTHLSHLSTVSVGMFRRVVCPDDIFFWFKHITSSPGIQHIPTIHCSTIISNSGTAGSQCLRRISKKKKSSQQRLSQLSQRVMHSKDGEGREHGVILYRPRTPLGRNAP